MRAAPDLVLLNGNFITMAREGDRASAVAVTGDRFMFVGSNDDVRELSGAHTTVVDLGGMTVVPGLIDCHNHMLQYAELLSSLNLQDPRVDSVREIVERLRRKAVITPPGSWIRGRGYDHNGLLEQRHPTRWELDAVTPNNPVLLTHASDHMSVANSMALRVASITGRTIAPDGGVIEVDASGETTGLLLESAQRLVRKCIPERDFSDLVQALGDVNRRYVAEGVTSSHDAGIGSSHHDEIGIFQTAKDIGLLQVRVNLMIDAESLLRHERPDDGIGRLQLGMGLRSGLGDQRLRIGPLKVYADGSLLGQTAAVSIPYVGEGSSTGMLVLDEARLRAVVRSAHSAGWQLAIHAIGDRAIGVVLDALQRAIEEHPRLDHRHRLEHCGVLNPSLVHRIKDLGLVVSTQPCFIWELGDSFVSILGNERCLLTYPLRSLTDRGIVVAAGSDRPVVDGNPMLGVHAAVNEVTSSGRPYVAAEKLRPEQALMLYTVNAAWTSYEEQIKGSIEPGKLADLAVLSDDLTAIPPAGIKDIEVVATMIGGTFVYQR